MTENVNKMSAEAIANEKRKRQLAILKASNEMLTQAKETAMKKVKDPMKRAELDEQFKQALQENSQRGKNYLHASQEEIDNAEFREVEDYYVEKYQERLKVRGLNDEELHRKEVATVTVGKKGKNEEGKIARRPRKGSKAYEKEIERIEGEEELMKLSMVKSDDDIKRQIEKNRQFEEDMRKNGHDIFAKAKEKMKEAADNTKVRVNNENVGRVEISVVEEDKSKSADVKKKTPVKTENFNVDDVSEVNSDIVEKKPNKRNMEKVEVVTYDFDFSSIPSYVQYDVIPLPSKGKCYPIGNPLRCGHVPVAYLTAADENIIVSPNIYRDGKLFDVLLENKILDKRIKVSDIVSGDRDAIILWLRATSYDTDFPISAINPNTGKRYNTNINLADFDYKDFDFESDANGLFEYITENGDILKFKVLTPYENDIIKKYIIQSTSNYNKIEVLKYVNILSELLKDVELSEEDATILDEDITEIQEVIKVDEKDGDKDYPGIITENMILRTVSINGNTDKEFIRNYINYMRAKESLKYRQHMNTIIPGIDFSITINIPESDGGGSFDTFLRLSDTIFINF